MRTSIWIFGRLYQSLETMSEDELKKLKNLAKKEADHYMELGLPSKRQPTHKERCSQHFMIKVLQQGIVDIGNIIRAKQERRHIPDSQRLAA